MSELDLKQRREIAETINKYYPGYGGCLRCNRNWQICQGHNTRFTPEHGMFPLCQDCWQELSIEERLPYYHTLWTQWQAYTIEDREESLRDLRLIEIAVREGL